MSSYALHRKTQPRSPDAQATLFTESQTHDRRRLLLFTNPLAMPRSNKKGAAVPRGAAPPQSAGRGKEMAQSRNLKPSAGTVGGAAATTPYRLEILQLEPCALRKRGGDDDDYFKGGQACCSSTRVAACLARCPVPDAQQHLPPDHSARPRPVFAGVRASGTPRPRPRRGGRVHRQRV